VEVVVLWSEGAGSIEDIDPVPSIVRVAIELSSNRCSEALEDAAGAIDALELAEPSCDSLRAAAPRFAALTAALTTVDDIVETSEEVGDALLRISWFKLAAWGGMRVWRSGCEAADVSSGVNTSISWGNGAPLGSLALGLRNSSKNAWPHACKHTHGIIHVYIHGNNFRIMRPGYLRKHKEDIKSAHLDSLASVSRDIYKHCSYEIQSIDVRVGWKD
jgi:hypothetical protein